MVVVLLHVAHKGQHEHLLDFLQVLLVGHQVLIETVLERHEVGEQAELIIVEDICACLFNQFLIFFLHCNRLLGAALIQLFLVYLDVVHYFQHFPLAQFRLQLLD